MLLLTLLALVVTGCGKTTEESQPITLNTGLESPVEIPIFGKKLTLEDELYKISCNSYYFDYFASKDSPDCKAVSVDIDYSTSTWQIKSADGNVNLSAEGENETLKIGEKSYRCYTYSGNYQKPSGSKGWFGSHLILVENDVTKPGDIKPGDIEYIGVRDTDLCESIQ